MVDEWVVVGPHEYLLEKTDLDDLEKKVYAVLKEGKRMSVSKIWRATPCHLWELDAALKRLRDKGLIVEE
jgi:DNA-binding Lrp family transcriptional regulator